LRKVGLFVFCLSSSAFRLLLCFPGAPSLFTLTQEGSDSYEGWGFVFRTPTQHLVIPEPGRLLLANVGEACLPQAGILLLPFLTTDH